MRKIFWMILVFGLLLFSPAVSSACDLGDGHENMSAAHDHSSLVEMTSGIREEPSSAHQILEVMLGINSLFLNALMAAGIYWLIKSAKHDGQG